MSKRKSANPFQGRWRITWMEQWDQEFVDEEVEGYFEFEPKGLGSFQFGYVRGQIDYRPSTRDVRPCIEFTWDGNDEMDPAQGRGWAVVDGDELDGMIFFHMGDESKLQDLELSIHEWGRVIFSLCGAKQETHVCKQLMTIARKIANHLSEVLGIDTPEGSSQAACSCPP